MHECFFLVKILALVNVFFSFRQVWEVMPWIFVVVVVGGGRGRATCYALTSLYDFSLHDFFLSFAHMP